MLPETGARNDMKKAFATAAVIAASISVTNVAPAATGAPAPTATYWMDVATQSGIGAGMGASMGRGMNPAQAMAMMNRGGAAMHMLDLRLASKTRPAGAPQA